eukprot:TRINITY_DN965_c0_g6_i1.p2 TRINITY_DN965_c0_g6~~TRINITY_DN965_c0_g6_i1.p2  ORF type:complete len:317 (-),score=84.97 TRINITY_DN965_c0_g6_i1:163-1056(-)
MAKQLAVAGAAAGACLLVASDAFVAPQSGAVGSRSQFLKAQAVSQQALGPASGASSTALFAGTAGLLAFGAAAAAGRKAVRSPAAAPKICALPKALEGTGGPRPNDVWDPIGLMNGKSEEQILHWRAVELRHGRVGMLAVLGWFHVAGGWHFIGDFALGYRASDNPLINVQQLPMGGMWQMVFFFVCIEWLLAYVCKPPAGRPWDVLGWNSIIYDEEEPQWKERQLQEINNGRLAMVAILGLIAQDAATGTYFKEIAEPCFGACGDPVQWLKDGGEPLVWPVGPIGFPKIYPGQGPF